MCLVTKRTDSYWTYVNTYIALLWEERANLLKSSGKPKLVWGQKEFRIWFGEVCQKCQKI